MSVKLVGITQPVVSGVNNAEELVAYAARVSNPGNQHNVTTAPKLLQYLVNHQHWSPFEMVSLVLEINTTRDIARQILRHRSFSFQEFSQRYAQSTELGFETREARLQDHKNRQASVVTDDRELHSEWEYHQTTVLIEAKKAYQWALDNGIAKEQARSVLPEGMTHSRLYMNGTLRSWIHYCQLRTHESTQKEHRQIALECQEVVLSCFPSLRGILEIENI